MRCTKNWKIWGRDSTYWYLHHSPHTDWNIQLKKANYGTGYRLLCHQIIFVRKWLYLLITDCGLSKRAHLLSHHGGSCHQDLLLHLHHQVALHIDGLKREREENHSLVGNCRFPPCLEHLYAFVKWYSHLTDCSRRPFVTQRMDDWRTFRRNSLDPRKYPSLSIKLLSSLQIFIGRWSKSK